MDIWKKYQRKGLSEMRAYVEGEQLPATVSVSEADKLAGSPKAGDMIARNPRNHNDQWLVAAKYFNDNLAPADKEDRISIELSCRNQDGGDGGWSVTCYPDDEALLAAHPLCEGLPPTPEQRATILNEEDPYANGYITHKTLNLVKVDGEWRLDGKLCMHFGQ